MKFIIIALTALLLCFDNQVYASGQQISAQYDDFEWGMSPDKAKKLVRAKGIEDLLLMRNDPASPEVRIFAGFEDMLLDAPVRVTLDFTPKSQRLFEVTISASSAYFPYGHPNREKPPFLSTNAETVIRSLDQKYGKHRKQRLVRNVPGHTNLMQDRIEEVFSWGSPESGTLISITFDPTFPNLHRMVYTNAEMKALYPKEVEEIREANERARQQKINDDLGGRILQQMNDGPRKQASAEESTTLLSGSVEQVPQVDTTSNFISVDGKVVPNPNKPISASGEAVKSGKGQAIRVVPSDEAVPNANEEINQKEKSMPEALAEYDAWMENKRVARQAAWDKRQAERKAEREKRQAVRKSRKNPTKGVAAPEKDDTSTAKIIGDSSANDNEPGLRVKGLYIGMGIDQASTILHELLGVPAEVKECNETEDLMYRFDRNAEVKYVIWGNGSILLVKAGGDRKVSSLTFPGSVVDKLFNVSGIGAGDFAKNFSSGYGLPKMDYFSDSFGRTGWEYSSPNGYKVQIYESKDLHITKLPKRSEMQFN